MGAPSIVQFMISHIYPVWRLIYKFYVFTLTFYYLFLVAFAVFLLYLTALSSEEHVVHS